MSRCCYCRRRFNIKASMTIIIAIFCSGLTGIDNAVCANANSGIVSLNPDKIDSDNNKNFDNSENAEMDASNSLNKIITTTTASKPFLPITNTQLFHTHTATTQPPDSEYYLMKTAFDGLAENMNVFMAIYLDDMKLLTTTLRNLNEKMQTLEVLQHDIDELIDHRNVIDQSVNQMRQNSIDSQTIGSKLDRLEITMQYLLNRVDLLSEKEQIRERQTTVPTSLRKERNEANMDDGIDIVEQTVDCESKIDHLISFVHSFAEINRLESSDILGRLSSMQSQVIDFFAIDKVVTKPTIPTSSRNNTNNIEAAICTNLEENNQLGLHDSKQINNLSLMNVAALESTAKLEVSISEDSSERAELKFVNETDQLARVRREIKFENKKYRWNRHARIMKKRRDIAGNSYVSGFQLEYPAQCELMLTYCNQFVNRNRSAANLQNPKKQFEINHPTRIGKQFNAKYDQPSQNGCHQFANINRADVIHRFEAIDPLRNTYHHLFNVRVCSFDQNGIAWTVIQSRGNLRNWQTPAENFNRSWIDYKNGFGNLNGEFWYGNDFIHQLTYDDDMELKIILENWDNRRLELQYEVFRVDSEQNHYNLFVNGFHGANKSLDALAYHHNQDFSTFDRQNDKSGGLDKHKTCCSCAKSYAGGWWFNNCMEANLNGVYQTMPWNNNYVGIIWENWLGDYSLKATKIMIRPKIDWRNRNRNNSADDVESSVRPPDDP